MVVKVYISGMSGNKEVKKRQQRVMMILESKSIKYEIVDITEPGKEDLKDLMQTKSTSKGGTVSDPNPRHPLPPQLFCDDEYCGDYDAFDLANEVDTLEQFLKQAPVDKTNVSNAHIALSTIGGSPPPISAPGNVTPAPEQPSTMIETSNVDDENKENGGGDENKEDAANINSLEALLAESEVKKTLTDSEKLILSEQVQ